MVLYGFQEALIEPSKLQLLANHSGVGGNIMYVEQKHRPLLELLNRSGGYSERKALSGYVGVGERTHCLRFQFDNQQARIMNYSSHCM